MSNGLKDVAFRILYLFKNLLKHLQFLKDSTTVNKFDFFNKVNNVCIRNLIQGATETSTESLILHDEYLK